MVSALTLHRSIALFESTHCHDGHNFTAEVSYLKKASSSRTTHMTCQRSSTQANRSLRLGLASVQAKFGLQRRMRPLKNLSTRRCRRLGGILPPNHSERIALSALESPLLVSINSLVPCEHLEVINRVPSNVLAVNAPGYVLQPSEVLSKA